MILKKQTKIEYQFIKAFLDIRFVSSFLGFAIPGQEFFARPFILLTRMTTPLDIILSNHTSTNSPSKLFASLF